MSEIEITDGDTEQLIPQDQANQPYIAEVTGADIRLGHSERYAKEGTLIVPGDRVRLSNLRQKPVYAYADGGNATVDLDHAGINVEYMARATTSNISQVEAVNEVQTLTDAPQLGNETSVTAASFDPTNSPPSISVPDNATVVVKAASGNGGAVTIDGAFDLAAGESVRIRTSDTGNITTGGTSGDEVQLLIPGGS